jgi:putative ABC transport system permease protein
MVLYKKVIRNMLAHKSKYIGALLLIILGTALYTSFSIAGPQILKGIEDFRENYKVEDASFITAKEITDIEALEKQFNVVLEKRKVAEVEVFEGATLRVMEKSKRSISIRLQKVKI